MIKKLLIALGVVIGLVLVAIIVVPHFIDWNPILKSTITTTAKEITGRDLTIEQAYGYAREIGLNLIAVMKAELGDLDRVKRIVKMLGMVNAVPEFGHQPEVINGCSDLFVEVFGDRGRHARSAVGVGSLPRGIPVEIEVIVEVEDAPAWRAAATRKATKKAAKKKKR